MEKITLKNTEGSPIIISHRTIERMPKIRKVRTFLGLREGLKNLLVKSLDSIIESFWTEERIEEDPGKSRVVHYAFDVEDDGTEPDRVYLTGIKTSGESRSGAGMHFEVCRVLEEQPKDDLVLGKQDELVTENTGGKAKAVQQRIQRPNLPMTRPNFLNKRP